MKVSAAVSRSLREGTLWVLGALALLLLLALLSYHPHDPGFSDTGEPGPVGNWIGPVGAWLAGFFLFIFGRPAYLFPCDAGLCGLVGAQGSIPAGHALAHQHLAAGLGIRSHARHQLRSRLLALERRRACPTVPAAYWAIWRARAAHTA